MNQTGPDPAAVDAGERYDIVAMASSAGGIRALAKVLNGLPNGFPVPILVVQHLDRRHRTVIADVLGHRTGLHVRLAAEGDVAQAGTVHIAPPDHHLLVSAGGELTLSHSELVHFVRPSADLLFESLAGAYGTRAIACVLSGTGSDGSMGVTAVKSRGGTVIAQDPDSAEFRGMPDAAVATSAVDFVLPLEEISTVLLGLVGPRSSE